MVNGSKSEGSAHFLLKKMTAIPLEIRKTAKRSKRHRRNRLVLNLAKNGRSGPTVRGTEVFSTLISEKVADITKLIYGERSSKISRREQTAIKLKTVKYAKMQKDYKKALNIVNEILERDPGFYEAKFAKAQILEEGFRMTQNARGRNCSPMGEIILR